MATELIDIFYPPTRVLPEIALQQSANLLYSLTDRMLVGFAFIRDSIPTSILLITPNG